jgi:hypothetical protein
MNDDGFPAAFRRREGIEVCFLSELALVDNCSDSRLEETNIRAANP